MEFNIFFLQDFEGQGQAEWYSQIIITIFGVVGFILGWYLQQFSQTVLVLAAGFIIAAIVSFLKNNSFGLPQFISFFKKNLAVDPSTLAYLEKKTAGMANAG